MKTIVVGLCFFGFATLSEAVQAQCGCVSTQYAPMMRTVPMAYSAPMVHSMPLTHSAPVVQPAAMTTGSVLFVNKLSTPVDRGAYSLLYAVHLSNGRLLYTDVLPTGFTVRGTEAYRSGQRANVNVGTDGRLNVNDPVSNQVIAVLPQ